MAQSATPNFKSDRIMIKQGIHSFKGKRVLLLQGPIGPFFRRLAQDLTEAGAHVSKVNFNGGDWFFYPSEAFNFRRRKEDWPAYFDNLLEQLHIDVVMLFGDCRPMHVVAHDIAMRRGLEIGVFEEGYIRPDFVTLERFGVNNHSQIPRSADFYLNHPASSTGYTATIGNTYWYMVTWAILYYFFAGLLTPFFRHYRHHRPLNWLETLPWIRSAWRKVYFAFKERNLIQLLTCKLKGNYFLVPLQVHNDAQVHVHSDFDSIPQFIENVMTSFANHAPLETALVIKHHPFDRGYHDYSGLIQNLSEKLGIAGRCFYIHDQHLPTLLECARGSVVINSTVGLSALHHGTPLKVCGSAIYDLPGLTFQGGLDDFWQNAQQCIPNRTLLGAFYCYLVQYTQLNGSFYKRLRGVSSATGLIWDAKV